MGILDEAIRDHLELKRKGGAQETDLRRLEDEAFGPPSRPGDAAAAVAAPAQMAEALKHEPSPPENGGEISPPAEPKPEPSDSASVAPVEQGDDEPEAGGAELGGAFHDFAAEEGLVSPSAEAPAGPVEREAEPAPEPPAEPAPAPEPAPEDAPPADEASLDDTQPHDMQTEIGAAEEPTPAPEPSADLDVADEDLELRLEDDEGQSPSGDLRVVEDDEELVVEEVEVEVEEVVESGDEGDDEGDDVLEETPDFLRESPEHDRLWFEQRPPKDFDFDE